MPGNENRPEVLTAVLSGDNHEDFLELPQSLVVDEPERKLDQALLIRLHDERLADVAPGELAEPLYELNRPPGLLTVVVPRLVAISETGEHHRRQLLHALAGDNLAVRYVLQVRFCGRLSQRTSTSRGGDRIDISTSVTRNGTFVTWEY